MKVAPGCWFLPARAEGRSWRSVAAALDAPVSTAGCYLAFLFLGLLVSAGRFLGGLLPLNGVTEKFREGVRDFCPPREVTSARQAFFVNWRGPDSTGVIHARGDGSGRPLPVTSGKGIYRQESGATLTFPCGLRRTTSGV